jgi:hypothetical protein
LKECRPSCGKYVGYNWLNSKKNDRYNFYISSKFSNVSHDLLILDILRDKNHFGRLPPSVKSIVNKLQYVGGQYYGTEEIVKSGLPNKIRNVSDAFIELKRAIMDPVNKDSNDAFFVNIKKLGDLHIYPDENKPMVWKKV